VDVIAADAGNPPEVVVLLDYFDFLGIRMVVVRMFRERFEERENV
jgi:hypothetical protein